MKNLMRISALGALLMSQHGHAQDNTAPLPSSPTVIYDQNQQGQTTPATTTPAATQAWTSAPEIRSFQLAVQAQLDRAQNRVDKWVSQIQDRSVAPSDARRMEMENAITQLQVKQTLAGNFWNNPVIQSPAVRNHLLLVLQKDNISEGDLAYLQSIVNSERARMQQAPVAPSTPPATAPTP